MKTDLLDLYVDDTVGDAIDDLEGKIFEVTMVLRSEIEQAFDTLSVEYNDDQIEELTEKYMLKIMRSVSTGYV